MRLGRRTATTSSPTWSAVPASTCTVSPPAPSAGQGDASAGGTGPLSVAGTAAAVTLVVGGATVLMGRPSRCCAGPGPATSGGWSTRCPRAAGRRASERTPADRRRAGCAVASRATAAALLD